MRKYLALFLAAFVFFSGGCTVKNGGAPTQMQVEAKRDQLTELSSSKTVSIVGQPYLGAKPIVRESGEEIPVLGKNVTLKQQGTLSEIGGLPQRHSSALRSGSGSRWRRRPASQARCFGAAARRSRPAAPCHQPRRGRSDRRVVHRFPAWTARHHLQSKRLWMGLRRQNEPRHIQRNAGTDVHRTGRAGSRFIRKPALEQEPGTYWWFLHQRFEHQFNRFVWRYVRTNLSNQQNRTEIRYLARSRRRGSRPS